MKKTKTQSILRGLVLGMFLGIFFVPLGGVRADEALKKCSEATPNTGSTICEIGNYSHCKWSPPYTNMDGVPVPGRCYANAADCWEVNTLYNEVNDPGLAKRNAYCTERGCNWNDDKKSCYPETGYCESRNRFTCFWSSDCAWRNDQCQLKGPGLEDAAVSEMIGFCDCKSKADGKQVSVLVTGDRACSAPNNPFWIKEIPSSCDQPRTAEDIQSFCDTNAADMTSAGKKKCARAIRYRLNAISRKCIEDAETVYNSSLQDEAARERRRVALEQCGNNMDSLYPGATFNGGGLRSGALIAHDHLTKSISHQVDLKTLILGWVKFSLELVAIIAVVAVVWAGILYITDMGDGSRQEQAKKILIWVVVGILVIAGSYAIVNTLMTADFSTRVEIINSFHI